MITLQGDKELSGTLRRLAAEAPRIGRGVALAGASVVAAAIRRAAPGRVKQEIGYRLESGRRAMRAKAGIGVARRTTGRRPIGFWVALGTRRRRGNPFVRRATRQSTTAALVAMRKASARAIERAVLRAKG